MTVDTQKEKIFIEIRQTIKYLLREREQGKEDFEISDFFKRNLENSILENFDNSIDREEYEQAILSLFGAVKRKKVKITKGLIRKEVEKLIRQYRMRSKKQILQKLIEQFLPPPSEIETIRDYVNESYNILMYEPLQLKITALVKEGTTDLRRVINVLRRENFEVEEDIIKKILEKAIAGYEKSKIKYKRERRSVKTNEPLVSTDDYLSPVRVRLHEQMRKSLIKKAKFRRQWFIKNECPKFKFNLIKSSFENDMQALEFMGERGEAAILVKILLANDRIGDVQINCVKKGESFGAIINVAEFIKAAATNQSESYLQRWLKTANKQLMFGNIQELLWFLIGVLNDRFGLPIGVSNYLKKNFIQYLLELDKSLAEYVIEKALENI
jgi:hypothetical protein